jgi:HEAT repeat protein
LRLVARTRLSSSASAWRAWLAREERWWQERAPERLALLADDTTLAVGDVHRLVGELCAHPLQREALAPALAPLLGHSDPAVRVIGCQALATLGARSGAPLLYPLLRGGPVEVVTAARSALVAITGVEWRGTPEVMAQRLAARGFFALD